MQANSQTENQTTTNDGVQQSRPDGDNPEQKLINMGYDLDALDKDNPHNQWMTEGE